MCVNRKITVKTTLVVVFLSLFQLNSSYAQDDYKKIDVYKYQKRETYRTWVSLNKAPLMVKGIFFESKDSSIIVDRNLNNFIDDDLYFPLPEDKPDFINIPVINIDVVKIRRIGKVGRGIGIGALSGFATGIITGLIMGDDPPDQLFSLSGFEKGILLGIPLAAGGACIGGLIGSTKITIPINGSISNYNRNKNKLKRYSQKKY